MNWNTFYLDYRMLIARGFLSVAFGIMALLWPAPALLTIALLYGAYAFADGIAAIASGVRRGRLGESWGVPVVEGVLGVLAGAFTFVYPGITLYALTLLVGAWAVLTGLVELYAAMYRPRVAALDASRTDRVLLGLAGAASVLLGVIVAASPGVGAAALLGLVAGYALVFGAILITLGFRLRSVQRGIANTILRRAA